MATETIALPEDYGWSLAETSRWRSLLRVARKNPLGVVGFTLILGFVLLGALGPFFAPHSPTASNLSAQLAGPSLEHPFGTDSLGRDMLSRVMSGARLSLLLGLAAVGLGVGIGAILGVISGYYGGFIDSVIQRTGEMGAAFPTLVLYLMLIAVLGQSLRTLIIAIAIFSFIGGSRVLRALTIVSISHDLNMACLFGDRILMLREGEIRCVGKPVDVVNSKNLEEVFQVRMNIDHDPETNIPFIKPTRQF